jgi:hypothetical protein
LICKPENLSRPSEASLCERARGPSPSFRQWAACLDDVIGSARDPCFVPPGSAGSDLGQTPAGCGFLLVQTGVGE